MRSRLAHVNELVLEYARHTFQGIKDRYTLHDEKTLISAIRMTRAPLTELQINIDEVICVLSGVSYL